MLNVGKIENGIVLDHIEAGKAMLIYHYLHLDREDYQVAIIKNARSNDMGRKDILKVECDPDTLSLDAVALIEPNTTVNIIKGGVIVEKKKMDMPKEVYGVLKCHNPRSALTLYAAPRSVPGSDKFPLLISIPDTLRLSSLFRQYP